MARDLTIKFLKTVAVLFVLYLLMYLLMGCTTQKIVEVEKVRTDTIYKSKIEKDSVWVHDSIRIKVKGDSVWVDRWHTKWRERILRDTLYQARVDSIPVPYPVEKLVEKKLNWWQQGFIWTGFIVWIVSFIYVLVRLYKAYGGKLLSFLH